MRLYLIKQWKNPKVDPTYIESRIQLYSFFTIGLIELILVIWGFFVLANTHMIDLIFSDKYDDYDTWEDDVVAVSFVFYVIYALCHFSLYVIKLIFFCLVYLYFWYWGGLEDPNDPYENTDSLLKKKDSDSLMKRNTQQMIDDLSGQINTSVKKAEIRKQSSSHIKNYNEA